MVVIAQWMSGWTVFVDHIIVIVLQIPLGGEGARLGRRISSERLFRGSNAWRNGTSDHGARGHEEGHVLCVRK